MSQIGGDRPAIDPSFLAKGTNVVCEKCGNYTFAQVFLIKHFSKLISPNGQEGLLPIPTYACNACGHINSALLPAVLKPTADEPAATKPSLVISE